tara:strand:+ start:1132 stop:1293 length:162 start_codon:yes stop_codon:yes gene_type:complete
LKKSLFGFLFKVAKSLVVIAYETTMVLILLAPTAFFGLVYLEAPAIAGKETVF